MDQGSAAKGLRARRAAFSRGDTSFLDSCPPDAPFGCVRLERLRFGPPEIWMGWKKKIGLVKIKDHTGPFAPPLPDKPLQGQPLPGLAQILAHGPDWQIWEWVDGEPLSTAVRITPLDNALAEITGLIHGLHDLGLAHGDLTPANIICRPKDDARNGRFCLIDWGDFTQGTPGWTPDDPHTAQERDLFALKQLEIWLKSHLENLVERSG